MRPTLGGSSGSGWLLVPSGWMQPASHRMQRISDSNPAPLTRSFQLFPRCAWCVQAHRVSSAAQEASARGQWQRAIELHKQAAEAFEHCATLAEDKQVRGDEGRSGWGGRELDEEERNDDEEPTGTHGACIHPNLLMSLSLRL